MAIGSLRRPACELAAGLAPQYGSLTFAHERLLPVVPSLAPLFGVEVVADGVPLGLTRGHTVMCTGAAAVSCALAIAAAPSRAGSWVAIVGEPRLGPLAAAEAGVVLERTVFVDDPRGGDPASVLSALVDGIEIILVPSALIATLSSSLVRRVQTRVQSRGGVLLVVGDTPSIFVSRRVPTNGKVWATVSVICVDAASGSNSTVVADVRRVVTSGCPVRAEMSNPS